MDFNLPKQIESLNNEKLSKKTSCNRNLMKDFINLAPLVPIIRFCNLSVGVKPRLVSMGD
jgi:hypothetical protein